MAIQSDPYAPNFTLNIQGVEPGERFLKAITEAKFEDESDRISSLRFTMNYRRLYEGGFNADLISSKFFSPGNLVVLRGGYGNDIRDIGAGYITELDPNFPDQGEPNISVTCFDQLHKLSLNKTEKGETFKDLRDSQIASTIGERNGFKISMNDPTSFAGIRRTLGGTKTRVQKRGQSDLDFLKELAKLNAYELFCKWDDKGKRFLLFFEPPKDRTKPVFTYMYDMNVPYNVSKHKNEFIATLNSFKPKISIAAQYTKYKVFSFDRKTGKKIAHTLTMDEFMQGQEDLKLGGLKSDELLKKNAATSGAGVRQKAFGDVTEIVGDKNFASEQEAKEYLRNHMRKIARDFITGTGKIIGNQYMQSRQVNKFGNLGAFFDGNYFMKKVVHVFNDAGYKGSLTVRKTIKEQV